MTDVNTSFLDLLFLKVREGPPNIDSISFARANDARPGNLTRTNRDTDWPIGCSESESKSGLTSGCPMFEGGPVTSLEVVDTKQRGVIHIYWSRQQNNSLLRFCLPNRRTTVHTACQQKSPQCNDAKLI
jgi:hypothetical protein